MRLSYLEPLKRLSDISIHAPRVGCDIKQVEQVPVQPDFNPRTPCGVRLPPLATWPGSSKDISIHAPRVGCDDNGDFRVCESIGFQSTHPVWGATDIFYMVCGANGNFNPRTPCGVRPLASITVATAQALFQSTHPVWGATLESPGNWFLGGNFNPRTPCGVRQEHSSFPCGNTCNFNPRTPCGVRRRPARPTDQPGRDFNPRTPCGVRPV